jgi:predicted aminopeptidase
MDLLKILLITILISSCAKLDYLYEQSVGQMSLMNRARANEEVIKNVRIPKDDRAKIKKIEELKKYFYYYWGRKETAIYSKTSILKSKAVSYLVIASPFNEIKAEKNCFPLMGCFPYLGFFNTESAQKFAKEKENDGLITWVRPVYAYSTLGYFTDNILSSFFHYNDYELAELIFHELFHTIFFVKNEVDLNENLANYFSKEMLEGYFKSTNQEDYLKIHLKEDREDKELSLLVVELVEELDKIYKNRPPQTKSEAEIVLKNYLESKFRPEILKKCQALNIEPKKCHPLEKKWNNARFAAFLTYEKNSDDIEKLQKKLKLDLKGYFNYIETKYNQYKKEDPGIDFSDYLLGLN